MSRAIAESPLTRIATMIAAMAEVLGVSPTQSRVRGYVEALADIPPDTLREAIRRSIQAWRYPDMPKPADLRAMADAVLAEPAAIAGQLVASDAPLPAHCVRCDDSGWVFVAERTDAAAPTVKRCPCYRDNPRLVTPKPFLQAGHR